MEVTINVVNEMKKLRNSTYSNKYAWVKEIIQNSQRSGASHIRVELNYDSVTISDDGVGCTNPKHLFEKNVSGWNTTIVNNENPFGEGFFSTIMAANTIEVESVGFNCVFDVLKMFRENTTDVVTVDKNKKKSGFTVKLSNFLPFIDYWGIEFAFRDVGKYIKKPSIFINGEKIKYEGTNPDTNKPFIHYIDNEYFKGWIRPYSWRNGDWDDAIVKCFAFNRLIKDSTKTAGVTGVLNFKSNSVNLRSPDREEFIFDDKYDTVYKVFLNEVRKMYIKVVRKGTDTQIKNFETFIDKYTTIDDYKKFIKFKFVSKDVKPAVSTTTIVTDDKSINNNANSNVVAASVINENINNINTATYNNENLDKTVITPVCSNTAKNVVNIKDNEDFVSPQSGEKIDGRSAYGYYVKSDEMNNYTEQLAIAEYYHIPVIEIRNCLEENIIKSNVKFNHISEMSNNITLTCKYSNTQPQTEYEIRVLKLLKRVMEAIDVDNDLFVICDAHMNKILTVGNKQKPIEKIEALATAYKGKIYLNRKYLYAYTYLKDTSDKMTMEDIRFIMLNLETICHEMSHALYGNDDNTKSHLECINYLMQKIINVIFNCTDKPIYI